MFCEKSPGSLVTESEGSDEASTTSEPGAASDGEQSMLKTAILNSTKKGETLKIIQQLRDEVHRFGITHHRNKRSKGVIKTELSEIKGIGASNADALLKHFRSVKKVKEATLDELISIIGKAKGKIVYDYFQIQINQ
jgi:excinuclease UvrABC nuclease subunit